MQTPAPHQNFLNHPAKSQNQNFPKSFFIYPKTFRLAKGSQCLTRRNGLCVIFASLKDSKKTESRKSRSCRRRCRARLSERTSPAEPLPAHTHPPPFAPGPGAALPPARPPPRPAPLLPGRSTEHVRDRPAGSRREPPGGQQRAGSGSSRR